MLRHELLILLESQRRNVKFWRRSGWDIITFSRRVDFLGLWRGFGQKEKSGMIWSISIRDNFGDGERRRFGGAGECCGFRDRGAEWEAIGEVSLEVWEDMEGYRDISGN
jgi:hypothetical protein